MNVENVDEKISYGEYSSKQLILTEIYGKNITFTVTVDKIVDENGVFVTYRTRAIERDRSIERDVGDAIYWTALGRVLDKQHRRMVRIIATYGSMQFDLMRAGKV